MNIMNKSDLMKSMAAEAGISEVKTREFYDAFVNTVVSELKQQDGVVDLGAELGKLSVGQRSARKGVNPRTGEELMIPASRVVKFKAGKRLKEAVNS